MPQSCGPDKVDCIYCSAFECSNDVPDVDDEEQWDALADEHDDDCEWVLTRAHQRPNKRQSAAQTD